MSKPVGAGSTEDTASGTDATRGRAGGRDLLLSGPGPRPPPARTHTAGCLWVGRRAIDIASPVTSVRRVPHSAGDASTDGASGESALGRCRPQASAPRKQWNTDAGMAWRGAVLQGAIPSYGIAGRGKGGRWGESARLEEATRRTTSVLWSPRRLRNAIPRSEFVPNE